MTNPKLGLTSNQPIITFKSSLPLGDLWYALAGIGESCRSLNAKADLYIWLDRPGFFYAGAKHHLGGLMFTEKQLELARPLIEAQPWCNSLKAWNGEKIMVDLDRTRQSAIGAPYGYLPRWYFYCFPDMACDLSKPWIHNVDVNDTFPEDAMIVNFTERYRNYHISYHFLKKYEGRIIFAGLEEEYETFNKAYNLETAYLKIENFMDLASAIKSARCFLGNQSMCFALAEALKAPRILEVCEFAPNVIPSGGEAYDFYFQDSVEFYVDKLMK